MPNLVGQVPDDDLYTADDDLDDDTDFEDNTDFKGWRKFQPRTFQPNGSLGCFQGRGKMIKVS